MKSNRTKPTLFAPEVLLGQQQSTKSDVWYFGILLHELFSRKIPYEEVLMGDQEYEQMYEACMDSDDDTMILKLNDLSCSNKVVRFQSFNFVRNAFHRSDCAFVFCHRATTCHTVAVASSCTKCKRNTAPVAWTQLSLWISENCRLS